MSEAVVNGGEEKTPMTEVAVQRLSIKVAEPETVRIKSSTLFARIKEAKAVSVDNKHFLQSLALIIVGSLAGIASLFIASALPIAMITVGSFYANDCHIRPKIPIILIVSGCALLLQTYVQTIKKHMIGSKSRTVQNELNTKFVWISISLTFLTFATFIATTVLVYGSDWPSFDDNRRDSYCNPTLFLFAFWMLNITYLFLAYVFAVILFTTTYACFLL